MKIRVFRASHVPTQKKKHKQTIFRRRGLKAISSCHRLHRSLFITQEKNIKGVMAWVRCQMCIPPNDDGLMQEIGLPWRVSMFFRCFHHFAQRQRQFKGISLKMCVFCQTNRFNQEQEVWSSHVKPVISCFFSNRFSYGTQMVIRRTNVHKYFLGAMAF